MLKSIKMKRQEIPVEPISDNDWGATDEILEALNDYLIEVWCDSKMKKQTKTGFDLMNDAIEYATKKLNRTNPVLISRTAKYLIKENKLIGLSPDDI